MPINAHPDYLAAERGFHQAETSEQKIRALKKMISVAPKHMGAENLRKQLKTRLRKLKYSKEKQDKSGKSSYKGIKKDDMQAVIVGETNSGKSSLLSILTNAQPEIADYNFTTKHPIIGMTKYSGTNIQLIENPAIESEYYNKGLTNTTDTIIIIITSFEQLEKINQELKNFKGKKIIVFNDKDKRNQNELRKLEATLKSKKLNFIILSLRVGQDSQGGHFNLLKEKIFKSFNKIRVYTKEPGKKKTDRPIILKPDSTVKDVAEKILHGFSHRIKESRVTGPSGKFPNQKVGLQHKLKDLDTVEFKTN
jgi:ribosome-interacting GTPase 1